MDLVNALSADVAAEWDFRITGNLKPPDVLGPLGRLKPTGLLASPLPLLAEARAVTIPSDLGMGFKTKILEAILAGCWVLVTEEVHGRLPEALHPWCRVIDPRSPARFAETLRGCTAPPPPGDPNALLRDEAFRGLDRVLAVDAEGFEAAGAFVRHERRQEAAAVGSSGIAVAVDRFRAGEPAPRSAEQGDLSFGEERLIYHTYLKPVLVRTGLIESSPAVFEYGVGRGHVLKSASEEELTCGVDAGRPRCSTRAAGAFLERRRSAWWTSRARAIFPANGPILPIPAGPFRVLPRRRRSTRRSRRWPGS